MKKRLLAGLLTGCIALSGCASMLERDYVSVTPHSSTTTDVGTSSVLRVENYPELVNSLIYFITNAEDSGVIRLYMDAASAEEMLYSARQEIMTKADTEMAEEAHDLALQIYKENAADADYDIH